MRIGEILIAASLVDAQKLQVALDYASSKSIPVGGALRALKYVEDSDLRRSLDAQQAITKGLDPKLAIDVLITASAADRQYVHELRHRQAAIGKDRISDMLIYWLHAPDSLESTRGGLKVTDVQISTRSPDKLVIQGDMFFEANQLLEAEQTYLAAQRTWEDEYYPPLEKIVVVLTKLANLYLAMNNFEEAKKLYKRALQTHSELSGPESVPVARAMEDLGDLYMLLDSKTEALTSYSRAIDILERHPDELSSAGRCIKKLAALADASQARTRIGELAVDAGFLKADQAEAAFQESKSSGQPLGVVLRSQGHLDGMQVESLMFAQTLLRQNSLPAPGMVRALKLANRHKIPLKALAETAKWVSEEAANDPVYKQLLSEQERLLSTEGILGPNDPEIASLAIGVGDLHVKRQEWLSAEILYKRAVMILEKSGANDRAALVKAYDKLAQVLYKGSKLVEVKDLLLKSLQVRDAAGAGQTAEAAKCLWLLGKLGMAQRNTADAMGFLNKARAIFELLGPDKCPKQLIDEIELVSKATQ
jgi:tetratricopeptide (TPR) repeat protein